MTSGSVPVVAVPLLLWLLAAALLAVPGIGHPRFAYNWEGYTAWRVLSFWENPDGPRASEVFALTDGLMTDSGRGPLVGAPIWLGWQLAGIGLVTMRLPIALLAATAVPLLWWLGRQIGSSRVATVAALLLALSPVFLLYGRTATLAGISIAPMLLTVLALRATLQAARWSAGGRALLALQALLITGAYGYAPIRLLWPLAIACLLLELVGGRGRRRWLLLALLVTTVTPAAGLVAIERATAPAPADPIDTISGYYAARGEQLFALVDHPDQFRYYLRPTAADGAANQPEGTGDELARRLIIQNSGDLLRLLLDEQTRPALTDYWNARGRLLPWALVPFIALGWGRWLWLGLVRWQSDERLLALVLLGVTVPMILTSRVHIGRLVFALPLLLLATAVGATLAGDRLVALARGREVNRAGAWPIAAIPALLAIGAIGWSAWQEAQIDLPPSREARIAGAIAPLAGEAAARGGAVLVGADAGGAEIEAIAAAIYRLDLDRQWRFVAVQPGEPFPTLPPNEPRPRLIFGGLLDRLPIDQPDYCRALYLVAPELEARFLANTDGGHPAACADRLRYDVLPG